MTETKYIHQIDRTTPEKCCPADSDKMDLYYFEFKILSILDSFSYTTGITGGKTELISAHNEWY